MPTGLISNAAYIVVVRTPNAKLFHSLLKAVQVRTTAWLHCYDIGIKVILNESSVMQTTLFLKSDLFTEYHVTAVDKNEPVKFCVNLAQLADFVNVFGCATSTIPTSLRLCYAGMGQPVKLWVEELGVFAECNLKTISSEEDEEPVSFDRTAARIRAKVICKASYMHECFVDFDYSSELMEVVISRNDPGFSFTTFGTPGEISFELDRESEIIMLFEMGASEREIRHKYRLSSLKAATKAFQLGHSVSTRIDSHGFLEFQVMVPYEKDTEKVAFVDFTFAPVVDSDEPDH